VMVCAVKKWEERNIAIDNNRILLSGDLNCFIKQNLVL